MLTAKGRETEVAKGLAVGADAYVTKPFSTRELVEQVHRLLAGEVNLRALRSRGGLLVAAVVGYVAAACVLLAGLVWTGLAPAQREALRTALGGQTSTLVLGGVLAVAGLILLLTNVVGRYPPTARRLAADTRLLLGPNPDHRLPESGPAELRELAEAVNELAERRRVAEREVERQVSTGRADVEHERNRLAALMADLTVAVLVCSIGGRILLYNVAARQLLTDDPALGLGRSVFGIVDRGLLTHALDRIQGGGSAPAHEATTLRDGQLLQVRLAPVRGSEGEVTGFVLVLEDLTTRLQTSDRRDVLLRDLIETTRASLASIRAAIETVLDYPDMDPQERSQFLEIVREESRTARSPGRGVGRRVGSLSRRRLAADRYAGRGPADRPRPSRSSARTASPPPSSPARRSCGSGSTATRSRGPPCTWSPGCATIAASRRSRCR